MRTILNIPIPAVRRLAFGLAFVLPLIIASACNKDDDNNKDPEGNAITNIHSVAITKFALQANTSVMRGLDSVYFAIDLENGVIFNADSLPKGTDVSKLATTISFYNSISEAVYTMEGGSHRTGESDYRTSPNDTIDFTGDVSLRVVSSDGENTMTYRIKVNVHKMDPDSLAWTEEAIGPLPSRMANPIQQKTVQFNGKALSFIEEADGTFTLATASENVEGWAKSPIAFSFTPALQSMAAGQESLYILDNAGILYTSPDGISWNDTGIKWIALIGAYGSHALGIASDASGMRHTSYPADRILPDLPLEEDFPIAGATNLVTFTNRWATMPTALISGGKDALGRLQSATWAYDGASWVKISNTPAPAIEGACLIPYFSFRKVSNKRQPTEFSVWMMMGGRLDDGSFNRKVYLSYDNGINWRQGSVQLDFPEYLPSVYYADFLVMDTPMNASLAGWKAAPKRPLPAGARIVYHTDSDKIYWDCPYIYLVGGIKADGSLSNTIWRGVLNRLSFKPII